ncbi:MAG: hypothetical protein IPJ65_09490 [Archangiaceae bacterium]|nr:hypothetical protein [Archangiaceae bacterium]
MFKGNSDRPDMSGVGLGVGLGSGMLAGARFLAAAFFEVATLRAAGRAGFGLPLERRSLLAVGFFFAAGFFFAFAVAMVDQAMTFKRPRMRGPRGPAKPS